ncbi:MAG: glutamate-1-semialdehyde 2,1-aminomutase [Brevinematia bacterium]
MVIKTMNSRGFKSNKEVFEESKKYLPGGVSSPVRSFYQVGGIPIFVKRGYGSKIVDVENNKYVDYIMSWGALILGHAHKDVVDSVKRQVRYGTTYGLTTEFEYILAKMISECIPSIEMVRFVNSGTEACMSAIRLARAFTGRNKIIKFEGCYHGHADYFLLSAGSGVAAMPKPSSRGIPDSVVNDTILLPFNDLPKFQEVIENTKDIACVILEPIPANMGVVLPVDNFVQNVSKMCMEKGILLIFDEVITGFRFGSYGVQNLLNVKPDITCLGKIIGGGFPLACFGGRRDIMSILAPSGDVYQAGTLSGNPIAVVAGITTLSIIKKLDYRYLEDLVKALSDGLQTILSKKLRNKGVNVLVNRFKTIFSVFFTQRDKVLNFSDAMTSDRKIFSEFFHKLLNSGIIIPPSPFESWFLSFSHSQKDIDITLKVVDSMDF